MAPVMEQCEAEKAEPQLKADAQCAEINVEDPIIAAHNDLNDQGHSQVRSLVTLAFHARKPCKNLDVETAEVLVGGRGARGTTADEAYSFRVRVGMPCTSLLRFTAACYTSTLAAGLSGRVVTNFVDWQQCHCP